MFELLKRTEGTPNGVILEGKGGVGKTSLAASLAAGEAIKHEYPDGVHWMHVGDEHVNTYGKENRFLILMEKLSRCLPVSDDGGKKAPDLNNAASAEENVTEYLKDKKALLVLDDVCGDFAETIHLFCGVGVSVLVTTQREVTKEDVDGLNLFALEALHEEDSWRLFSETVCGVHNASPQTSTCPITKRLVSKCHGHPLSLLMVASAIKFYLQSPHLSCSEMEEAANKVNTALDHATNPTHIDEQRHRFLFKCVATLLDSCPTDMRIHFFALAVLPDGYQANIDMLGKIWGMDAEGDALQALSLLHSHHLVQGDNHNGWSVHGMLMKYMKRKVQWIEGFTKVKERQVAYLSSKRVLRSIMENDVYSMVPLWNEVGNAETMPHLWETNKENWDKEYVLSLMMFFFIVARWDLIIKVCDDVRDRISKGMAAFTAQSLTKVTLFNSLANRLAKGLSEDEKFSYTVTQWKRLAQKAINLNQVEQQKKKKGGDTDMPAANPMVSHLPEVVNTILSDVGTDTVSTVFEWMGSMLLEAASEG